MILSDIYKRRPTSSLKPVLDHLASLVVSLIGLTFTVDWSGFMTAHGWARLSLVLPLPAPVSHFPYASFALRPNGLLCLVPRSTLSGVEQPSACQPSVGL